MGQGSITRKASDLRPLLLDRFRNAAAAYSLRPLTLSGQDNPVVKVRRSVDNTEQDFNPAQINDGTLEQFVNAGDVAPADYGTGAAAAYSLRHVSDGYTGDVVRVRRSVDNTEQDFNPTEIEDGTLTSFVGGQNLVLYSEQFDNAYWTKAYTTIGANATTAPNGSATAEKLTATTANNIHSIYEGGLTRAGVVYVASFYLKEAGYSTVYVGNVVDAGVNFNLSTGTVQTANGGASGTITSVGDGWYRCTITYTAAGTTQGAGVNITNGDNVFSFAGDGTSGIYIWGAQFEEGSTAGDYVPTTTTIAGDGHVTTWYDQSGNSNDATQATAASQPKLVSGGSLVTENGKPAIDFDGVNDTLLASGYSQVGETALSAFVAIQTPVDSGTKAIDFGYNAAPNSGSLVLFNHSSLNYQFTGFEGRYDSTNNYISGARGGTPTVNQFLATAIMDGSNSTAYVDGTQIGQVAVSPPFDFGSTLTFGEISNNYAEMSLQEFIIYHSDQSSNRELIETNVNHYYSIYSQTNDGFVTTWYDQSGNGNHATQATAASQPKIVSAGSLVVENGKAALDFDGVDDYFENTSIVVNQPSTYFVIYRYDDIFNINKTDLIDGTNSRNLIDLTTGAVHRIFAGASFITTIAGTLNQELSYNLFNGASSEKAINGGAAETGNASTDALDGLRVASNNSTDRLDGTIQELIIYDSDQSTKRQQIESNINTHYGIY